MAKPRPDLPLYRGDAGDLTPLVPGIHPLSAAHRNTCRCGSHLLAPAGSSFVHVQRNLLSCEGSRHDPVPCAWQPDSAQPLQSGQPVWRDPRIASLKLLLI